MSNSPLFQQCSHTRDFQSWTHHGFSSFPDLHHGISNTRACVCFRSHARVAWCRCFARKAALPVTLARPGHPSPPTLRARFRVPQRYHLDATVPFFHRPLRAKLDPERSRTTTDSRVSTGPTMVTHLGRMAQKKKNSAASRQMERGLNTEHWPTSQQHREKTHQQTLATNITIQPQLRSRADSPAIHPSVPS